MLTPYWKIAFIFLACFIGLWFVLPTLFSKKTLDMLPSWFPKTQVNLRLDLQEGSHPDLKKGFHDYLVGLLESTRLALKKDKIEYTDLHMDLAQHAITFELKAPLENTDEGELFKTLQNIDPDFKVQIEGGTHVTLTLSDFEIEFFRDKSKRKY